MVRTVSAKKPPKLPTTPEWLTEYRKRTALIDVIAMAFDSAVSDKEVREALIEVSEQLGAMFSPGGQPPP